MAETLVSVAGFDLQAALSARRGPSANAFVGLRARAPPVAVTCFILKLLYRRLRYPRYNACELEDAEMLPNEQEENTGPQESSPSPKTLALGEKLGAYARGGETELLNLEASLSLTNLDEFSWLPGRGPVTRIQALNDDCSTFAYPQDGLFHFATAGGAGARGSGGDGGMSGEDARRGRLTESLPVHTSSVSDFRVNPYSRDILSGGDDGHVHVLNFPTDMAGVPTMKASKYVGSPVSSVRWGVGHPYVASWTAAAGHVQMLDTRDYRLTCNIIVDGPLPVHTHEHISDVIIAVGGRAGAVQIFDVRNMSSFVRLQDPNVGHVLQIVPSVGDAFQAASGLNDWVAFGPGGLSRYTVEASYNGAGHNSANGDVMARISSGMSIRATCRTADMDNMSATLDMTAGLFLAPTSPGERGASGRQLCALSTDARMVTFASSSSAAANNPVNAPWAAPADGSHVAGGTYRGADGNGDSRAS